MDFLAYICGDFITLKRTKHIVMGIVWALICLYIICIVSFRIPLVQRLLGGWISSAISARIGSKAEIGRVEVGLFNRMIVDDVVIYDQEDEMMLKASRVSAKIDVLPLFKGHIGISSAQLFGLRANLYKEHAGSRSNFQFVLDSLASKEVEKKGGIDLSMHSLVIRNGEVAYHQRDVAETPHAFNLSHLHLKDISGHLSVARFNGSEIGLSVQKLSLKELSGIDIRSLRFHASVEKDKACVRNLELVFPQSELHTDSLVVHDCEGHDLYRDGKFHFDHAYFACKLRTAFNLTDFSSFVPSLSKLDVPMNGCASVEGTKKEIVVNDLELADEAFLRARTPAFPAASPLTPLQRARGTLRLRASGRVSKGSDNDIAWRTKINNFHADNDIIVQILRAGKPALPGAETVNEGNEDVEKLISRMGAVDFSGSAQGVGFFAGEDARVPGSMLMASGNLSMEAGQADVSIERDGDEIALSLGTHELNLQQILDNDKLGLFSGNLQAKGNLATKTIHANGEISRIDYNKLSLTDLKIDGDFTDHSYDGMFSMDNALGKIDFSGRVDWNAESPLVNIVASLQNLSVEKLESLGLPISLNENGMINADVKANLIGKDLNHLEGDIALTNFYSRSPNPGLTPNVNFAGEDARVPVAFPKSEGNYKGNYYLDELYLNASCMGKRKSLKLVSDFAEIDLDGEYDYLTLTRSLSGMVQRRLPSLTDLLGKGDMFFPKYPAISKRGNNKLNMTATIKKTDWLQSIFGLPVDIKKQAFITAYVDEENDDVELKADIPDFSYEGSSYLASQIELTSPNDTMMLKVHTQKQMNDGKTMHLNALVHAANDQLKTRLEWNDQQKIPVAGELVFNTDFLRTSNGKSSVHMSFLPSEIFVNDTTWNILPSEIYYSDKQLKVNHFTIMNGEQHIIINGNANNNPLDSLTADLKDVDIAYLMNILNFHPVEFSGKASGKAYLKAAFSNPDVYAQLEVTDFRFQYGRMGTLYATASYNQDKKQIDIDAIADDSDYGGAITYINGYVSPLRNDINLDIEAHGTRLEFVESFCGSFMKHVEAHADGAVRLWGDLGDLNLTGKLVANGELDITSLNTHYYLTNDTIDLVVDDILFKNDTIRDPLGNIGIVNGGLHHDHLTDLTFDFDITAQNLLCYDFPDYGDDIFFGKVYADGKCAIVGRKGRIDIDVNATPRQNSFIEYNAASPDALTNQEFISWRNKEEIKQATIPLENASVNTRQPEHFSSTDLRINFLINTTPEATLRLLMDKSNGDYIALNGTGTIRANYYNKGPFHMFGTYLIDHGLYRLTIQNFIKRDFVFQPGGTIIFGGDPYDAVINMPSIYTINSVPLSDLQMGNSFTSNNVRVDCLMNISGTAHAPHVEFDIDLPTVNSDAKQMVRSLINSEDEMNQQVIYLLGIGRFYTQNRNNAEQNAQQSQTSLAMQSLLSGTISQQINEVLKNYVNLSNWNFGANISTGDEGFNNAEYEGLLSGSLLNNRLLINGQFGYRDNQNATSSFIGDFDVRYLLVPNGNLALKVYNQTNDRYFTRNSLNTQGVALIMKKDFDSWRELLRLRRKEKKMLTQ